MPEMTLAPPVAAPAATVTPAATPTTAPAKTDSAPAPAPERGKTADNLSDAYSMLDRLAGVPEPEAKPNAKAKTNDAPGDDTKPATDTPAPGEGQKPADNGKKPVKAATLREAYDALKTESTAKITALQKQVDDYRTKNPVDIKKDPEWVKLTENLSKVEKRAAEYEEELRFANYERHPEYKEKYLQPFVDAYSEGQAWAAQLQVTDENGATRPGNEKDFDAVMRLYAHDPAQGTKMIVELFGDQAASVIYHAKEVQKWNGVRLKALDHHKKDGAEREKLRTEQMTNAERERGDFFNREVAEGAAKRPQWFKPKEGDTKHAELLAEGNNIADAAFGGEFKDPKTGQVRKLSPQELVKLHAAVRNQAGAFPATVHLLALSIQREKALEAKLKEFESSEPPGGAGSGRKPAESNDTWANAMADLTKRAR